ncbi:MAG: epoxyqueuosine reductase QueH [Eubacterium sp.]|nr:epoxyqueuosine reductase QueH [Eubacterium sp.]
MNRPNYQKLLDKQIARLAQSRRVPTLLLHSCCAPCSSYVLEYLSQYFRITVLYYNPNISPEEEYRARAAEQERLIREMPHVQAVTYLEGAYEPERFEEAAAGYEDAPEGGARCARCFRLRLQEAVDCADRLGLDYFATTLTISPLKNAEMINQIGAEIALGHRAEYLPSDFKKKNGFKRSIELSEEYGLYRQNYCGCRFSRGEAAKSLEKGLLASQTYK